MADHERGVPPSRRIAEELRQQISEGRYGPGDQLPSERALAAQYGTARNTAREAISILQAEGLVDVRHGKGAFVRRPTPLLRLGTNRYSRRLREELGMSPFRAEAAKQGRTARIKLTSVDRVTPPAEVAARLRVSDQEASVIRRENIFYADDVPVQHVTTYLPWEFVEGTVLTRLTERTGHPGGIHGVLEDRGHTMARYTEQISARMPRPLEARNLETPPGVPVIEVLHVSYDQDDVPFEVTYFVMRADQMGLTYDIPITD